MTLTHLQNRIEELDRLRVEARELKQVLDDALKEDAAFCDVDAECRDAASRKRKRKEAIWSQPIHQTNVAKAKDLKEEIGERETILTSELLVWRQQNNRDEIVGRDGATRKIKINIRLVGVDRD